MKPATTRTLIAALFTMIAATLGCAAPDASSDSDLSAGSAGAALQYYCSRGRGKLTIPEGAEPGTVEFESLRLLALESGDVAFDACTEAQARAWETPLFAGRLDNLWRMIFRIKGGAPLLIHTGPKWERAFEAAARTMPWLDAVPDAMQARKLKLGSTLTEGARTSVTVTNAIGGKAQILFAEGPATTIVHKHFKNVHLDQAGVEAVLKARWSEHAKLKFGYRKDNLVFAAVKETRDKKDITVWWPETARLEKLLPIAEGGSQRLSELLISVRCRNTEEVLDALEWLTRLE
jgi:hypothetical protein